jgi:hypothetical protein
MGTLKGSSLVSHSEMGIIAYLKGLPMCNRHWVIFLEIT